MKTCHLALVLGLLSALPRPALGVTQVVATIDGEPITRAMLERSAESSSPYGKRLLASPAARRQTLDRLIETKLLARAGAGSGVEREPAFAERMAEARATILAAMELDRYVAAHSQPDDVARFFAKDPSRFGSREIKASHILVADEAVAREALAEARKPGADFARLVRKYAKGPSAEKDGSLGWFGRGRMLPEFERAAFATPKGQVHPQPIRTTFGYHVILVEDVRGEDFVKLDAVKDRVNEALDHELRVEYVAKLKGESKIAVDEQALGALTP